METKANKNWWFLTINGLFAVLLGLMLLFKTQEFISSVKLVTGLAVAALGLVLLGFSVAQFKKDKSVGATILLSIFCLAVGIGIVAFRDLFFMLIGIWAVIVGIFQLIILVNIKRNLSNKNIILFNGLLTIALGIIMFFHPEEFSLFLIRTVGICACIFGLVMIYLSFVIKTITAASEVETGKE